MHTMNMGYTLDNMIGIALELSAEKDFSKLMQKILTEAMRITHCDAGTVYIKEKDQLDFYTVCTKSKGVFAVRGDSSMPPVPLTRKHVCACAAMDNVKINIDDVYNSPEYDFAGAQRYDKLNDYRTRSMLVIPMADEKDIVIGVLQLINSLDEEGNAIPFDPGYEDVVSALASLAAVSINNHKLAQEVTDLLHSFVSVMVDAIEARSAYNATHTRSMVGYAEKFIDWLADTGNEWQFDEDKRDAFLMSVWLHDIGKLMIPQDILDKPDRLGSRKDSVKSKLEITKLEAKVKALSDKENEEKYYEKVELLDKAWELIEYANTAGYIPDDTAGLLAKYAKIECTTPYGKTENLLTESELEAISIQKGTLTAKERGQVEKHVSYTISMLKKMGFGGIYENVPTWAGEHHEYLNGAGYPYKLTGDELSPESRLLTVIDIYDALTAEDRPYKPPMPSDRAFGILDMMCSEGKIDRRILDMFRESGAWQKEIAANKL